MNKRIFVGLIGVVFSIATMSQEVPHPLQNQGVYRFIDELAAAGVINVNQVIKPYSRLAIAGWLVEAKEKSGELTPRQLEELGFYLRDFGKEAGDFGEKGKRLDLLYYKDDLFRVTVNPILGGEVFTNSSGRATYWRNGIEVTFNDW